MLLDNSETGNGSTLTGKVVSSALHKQHLTLECSLELLEGTEVGTNILSNGCVRASPRLDGSNTIFRECLVTDKEFLVFSGEDIVGNGG